MTVKSVSRLAAEAGDREAIRDNLYRYCRGIDRCDEELLRGCYWENATDDHGIFKGTGQDFVSFALKFLSTMDRTQHFLGNILIDIDGNVAGVESYYRAYHRMRRENGAFYDFVSSGRFIDRFERRAEEWRVARRFVVRDWFREYADSADWEKAAPNVNAGGRKPDDASYILRP